MQLLVGIPADVKTIAGLPFHCAGEKYIDACARYAGATPVVIPSRGVGGADGERERLGRFDGILLPGSFSHIDPARYGGQALAEGEGALDQQRDASVFSVIAAAVGLGIPVLGICRGLQEINIAFGGSLEPSLHTREDRLDHREPQNVSVQERYAPAHFIVPEPGGIIDRIANGQRQKVNSLHVQGIETLGRGLRVEARAEDGLVEAVSVAGGGKWILAVQWHCEAQAESNPFYRSIFAEFRAAMADGARRRPGGEPERAGVAVS